jgi:hypothetical protein
MSALSPEADMLIVGINVCYVPKADISLPHSFGAAIALRFMSSRFLCRD